MEKLFALGICFLVLTSCSNKAEQKSIEINIPNKTEYSLTHEDSLRNSLIDRQYGIDWWWEEKRFDTIVKNGNLKFRIFEDTSGLDRLKFQILKKSKGGWTNNITLSWGRTHSESFQIKDWNKDGYKDVTVSWKWHDQLILFNPKKEQFIDFGDIGQEDYALDSTNLRYTFGMYKPMKDGFEYWDSELFNVDSNYQKVSLGFLDHRDFYFDKNKKRHEDSLAFIYVYSKKQDDFFDNNVPYMDRLNPRKQKIEVSDYDQYRVNVKRFLKNYWSKNYQKFIKSKKY